MAPAYEPLPGTADIWEPEVRDWLCLEEAARQVFGRYGYSELRTPIFERTDVFVRSIGDETDVVQKEMYTFEDRGGRSLTLRPEGTAGTMRAIASRGLSEGEQLRVFYLGPMFRGERPAAGRRRQFHQVGVEAVGTADPSADAEAIAMLVHYLEAIGVTGGRLLLNTRGVAEDRAAVAAALRGHFEPQAQAMCPDCQRRIATNVARVLDCKNPGCQALVGGAPTMMDLVGEDSRRFFASVCRSLERLGVAFEIAPRLVRGLDYYVHTVFEVVHSGLGAQDALAGGGRYRISLPGAKAPLDGVGFAAGSERLLMARESRGLKAQPRGGAEVFVAALGDEATIPALELAQQLRRSDLGLRVLAGAGSRSLKAQMRLANREGVRWALILGGNELAAGTVVCKDMAASQQEVVRRDGLLAWLGARLCP
jgi:histidyl-tRNA synthetase